MRYCRRKDHLKKYFMVFGWFVKIFVVIFMWILCRTKKEQCRCCTRDTVLATHCFARTAGYPQISLQWTTCQTWILYSNEKFYLTNGRCTVHCAFILRSHFYNSGIGQSRNFFILHVLFQYGLRIPYLKSVLLNICTMYFQVHVCCVKTKRQITQKQVHENEC
jgi:hypothetical protein